MVSVVRHITFDCAAPHEPYALAEFWSRVLGHPVDADDGPGADEVALDVPPGLPTLLFVRVPEQKSLKNRVHLDLQPEGTRDEEVERVLALGAVLVADMRKPNGRGWALLADPAGNEFCIEVGEAERAAIIAAEASRPAQEAQEAQDQTVTATDQT